MPIVLSRKGFDSSTGGMYSPLDSDSGEYVFLPRPEVGNMVDSGYKGVDYESLSTRFLNFNNLKEVLSAKDKLPEYGAHLDPDLTKVIPVKGWRPAFGQRNAAQGYLRNRGVGDNSRGTLFLFFSRFKPWEKTDSGLREGYYIYGWLEVGETLKPSEAPKALSYHPHFASKYREAKNNIVYVASSKISGTNLPGAGMFKKLSNTLRLSYHEEKDLLKWKLPHLAFKAFSRLKNYEKIGSDHCTAEWPQSFGQAAVCSEKIPEYEVSLSTVKEVRKWAINKIRDGIETDGGTKNRYL